MRSIRHRKTPGSGKAPLVSNTNGICPTAFATRHPRGLDVELGFARAPASWIEMLEPEVAEAVGRGAAALFLAGYGPKGIHSRWRRPFAWDDTRNRVRRDVLRSRRLARRATETGATILSGDNFNSAR